MRSSSTGSWPCACTRTSARSLVPRRPSSKSAKPQYDDPEAYVLSQSSRRAKEGRRRGHKKAANMARVEETWAAFEELNKPFQGRSCFQNCDGAESGDDVRTAAFYSPWDEADMEETAEKDVTLDEIALLWGSMPRRKLLKSQSKRLTWRRQLRRMSLWMRLLWGSMPRRKLLKSQSKRQLKRQTWRRQLRRMSLWMRLRCCGGACPGGSC